MTHQPLLHSKTTAVWRAVRRFGARMASIQVTILAVVVYFICLPPFVIIARCIASGRLRASGRWQRKEAIESLRTHVEKEW
ncbi:MAG: hypothetical protein NTU66_03555 [Elusimicrobia bacterium]|nr:hypothetical protein [Elusimicrobiota bacterium]